MRLWVAWPLLAVVPVLGAADHKLTAEERIELIRGLTAEYATAKVPIPRSKKPLVMDSGGAYDEKLWTTIGKEAGPAARAGDLMQVTKVSLDENRILLELNGGASAGHKWYDNVQVGRGGRTTPIGSGSTAPGGTSLALVFADRMPHLTTPEVKKMLAPVLDFNRRSAGEQYVESLPAPVQQAIKENRAVEGMDRDQVILALGRPDHKVRETVDGTEQEDWVFGKPPGRIVFVTFVGEKVVRIREAYAALGGSTAPTLPSPR